MVNLKGNLEQHSDATAIYSRSLDGFRAIVKSEEWSEYDKILETFINFMVKNRLVHIMSLARVTSFTDEAGEFVIFSSELDNKDIIIYIKCLGHLKSNMFKVIVNLLDMRYVRGPSDRPFIRERSWDMCDLASEQPSELLEELKKANRQISHSNWLYDGQY